MPTSQEIFALRKAGDFDRAYEMALELIEFGETDEWDIKAIGWAVWSKAKAAIDADNYPLAKTCLAALDKVDFSGADEMLLQNLEVIKKKANPEFKIVDKAKEASKAGNHEEALKLYREAKSIFPEDFALRTSLAWEIYNCAKILLGMKPIDVKSIRILLAEYLGLKTECPSKLHSLFLNVAYKIKDEATFSFAPFVKIWNLENLTESDFESYIFEEKLYPSLAEKIIQHTAKTLLNMDLGDIGWFTPHLDKAVSAFPESIWLTYYKTKFLRAAGQSNEAVDFLIPVIKAKSSEYWVWSLMGELHRDTNQDITLSCFCKALLCKSEEKFLSATRQKLAKILIEKRLYEEAKVEIKKIISSKSQESTNLPESVNNWKNQPWYEVTNTQAQNDKFYSQNTQLAEELSFSKEPWIDACLGPVFELKDKPAKFRRKIYYRSEDDNLIAQLLGAARSISEFSITANRFHFMKSLPVGTAIRVKGEKLKDKPFKLYLAKERELEIMFDIFPKLKGNITQMIAKSETHPASIRIEAIVETPFGKEKIAGFINQDDPQVSVNPRISSPVYIKAMIKKLPSGTEKLDVFSVINREEGEDWDLYEEHIGVVDYLPESGNKAHFIVSTATDGMIDLNAFQLGEVKVGSVICVRLQQITPNEGKPYSKVLSCSLSNSSFPAEITKKFTGQFKTFNNAFGFVDDVFVESSLLADFNITDGLPIKGIAIKSYNKKKGSWGWKAIQILIV